jgi:hypothetical protein
MREYKTRRGALLAQLEHSCAEPGVWKIEGLEVLQMHDNRRWYVEEISSKRGWFDTFTDALEAIAERTA